MTFRALAFGLVCESNLPLPGCLEPPADAPPDLTISLQPGEPDPAPADADLIRTLPGPGDDDPPLLQVRYSTTVQTYRFRYADEVVFDIDESAERIAGWWPESLTPEDAFPYLLGPVFGFVLRRRSRVCLHASAVAVDGRGVAFLAEAGFGKSTLAALFATRGHPVLTDDIAVLHDEPPPIRIQPGVARIALWPAAVDLLFGSADALPRITPRHPTWDKRYLALDGEGGRFQATPLPPAVIYTARHVPDAPEITITTVTGHEALLTLTRHAYSWYLLDRGMRIHDLEVMGRLLETVPLRSIGGAAHAMLSPDELYALIRSDLESL